MTVGNRQTIQMPSEMAEEITKQSRRLERSRSYLVVLAWKLARKQLRQTQEPL